LEQKRSMPQATNSSPHDTIPASHTNPSIAIRLKSSIQGNEVIQKNSIETQGDVARVGLKRDTPGDDRSRDRKLGRRWCGIGLGTSSPQIDADELQGSSEQTSRLSFTAFGESVVLPVESVSNRASEDTAAGRPIHMIPHLRASGASGKFC
jgi:hypothetical protein